jgi:hypothetical protein
MFKVGQKVVRIKPDVSGRTKVNEVYTISNIKQKIGVRYLTLYLKEIPPCNDWDGFVADFFRPLNDGWVEQLLESIIEKVEAEECVSA